MSEAEEKEINDSLRQWQAQRRNAVGVVDAPAQAASAIDLGRRGRVSPTQPEDYVCRSCNSVVAYYRKAGGPHVTLWSRGECDCERELRRRSDESRVAAEAEAQRNAAIQSRIRRERILGFSDTQRSVTFSRLSRYESEEMNAAARVIRNWCSRRASDPSVGRGFLLSGMSIGCGKTTLMRAAANYLFDAGVGVAMFDMATLLGRLREERNSAPETLGMVSTVPVLIIDDIGAPAISTAWQADQVFSMLDRRFVAGLPIMGSSNILDSRDASRTIAGLILAPRAEEFPDRAITAGRLESRLLALSQPLLVSGTDLRAR